MVILRAAFCGRASMSRMNEQGSFEYRRLLDRTFHLVIIYGIAICAVILPVHYWIADFAGMAALLVALLIIIGAYVLRYFGASLNLALQVVSVGVYLVMCYQIYRQGGVESPTTPWLILIPFLLVICRSDFAARVWFAIICITVGVFFWLGITGLLPSTRLGPYPELAYAIFDVALFVALITFLIIIERHRKWFLNQVSEAQRFAKIGHWIRNGSSNELLSCSDEYANIHGVEPDQIYGLVHEHWSRFIHPEDLDRVEKRVTNNYSDYEIDYRIVRLDGTVRDVLEIGKSLIDEKTGNHDRFGTVQDITETKNVESQLRTAKLEAETANAAKTEFLSSMSHELRTPLNAILGTAQLMQMDAEENRPENVENILLAGKHLLALIDDVLDIMRIEERRFDLEMIETGLEPVLEECITLVTPQADKAGITINTNYRQSSVQVYANPRRLKQVLLNILSNAVKYNRQQGKVSVIVEALDEGRIRVEIVDSGIGIAQQDFDNVFEPFNRFGSLQSKVEGTGVGLTISRQLVELMGGSMDFSSQLGEGTSFSIVLLQRPGAGMSEPGIH